jgi:hypothetical protein
MFFGRFVSIVPQSTANNSDEPRGSVSQKPKCVSEAKVCLRSQTVATEVVHVRAAGDGDHILGTKISGLDVTTGKGFQFCRNAIFQGKFGWFIRPWEDILAKAAAPVIGSAYQNNIPGSERMTSVRAV